MSYHDVESNLKENVNPENVDETMISTESPNPSYLLFEDSQSLKEENYQPVEILSTNECVGTQSKNEFTLSEKVTKNDPVSCNVDIINDVAVSSSELPSATDSDEVVTEVVEWENVVKAVDKELTRLGWDKDRGVQYLVETYGVKSRRQLTDQQIWEFLAFLQSQTRFVPGQTAMFQGVKVVIERLVNEVVAVVRSWDKPKERGFEVAMVHLT